MTTKGPTLQHTTADEPTALYFAYTPTAPDLDRFDVKKVVPTEILDRPATLTVLGESHYIGVSGLGFHEICSCKPLSAETMHYAPLERNLEQTFSFENERISATTVIETRAFDSVPVEESDVAYRFDPDAWTTISVSPETDAYETYHTYPEHDIALYTHTRLTPRPDSTKSSNKDHIDE